MAVILNKLRKPSGCTNIMAECNMSTVQSTKYLSYMRMKDLIRGDIIAGRMTYQRTEIGLEFLGLYNRLSQLLNPSTTWWWQNPKTESEA